MMHRPNQFQGAYKYYDVNKVTNVLSKVLKFRHKQDEAGKRVFVEKPIRKKSHQQNAERE